MLPSRVRRHRSPRTLTGWAPGRGPLGLLVVLALLGTALAAGPAAAAPAAQRLVSPTAVLDLPATAEAGTPVVADASRSSDPDGQVTSYTFTLDGGSPVRTTDPATTFTGLAVGRHTVTLVVTDDAGNQSAPVTAEVLVTDSTAPTAVLDLPTTAPLGSPVVADASRSTDTGGRIVSYTFTLDGGAPLRTTDPRRTLTGLTVGRHTVTLVVTDDAGNQSTPVAATVVVSDQTPPTAVLDVPSSIAAGTDLVASASRSTDVGGRVVEYLFTLDSGSPVRTTDPRRAFSGLAVGRHTVTLVVTDDAGNQSTPVTATVVVSDQTPPTAVLLAPTSVKAGDSIPLDGRKSTDRFGSVVQWVWTVGSNAPVTTKTPTFTAPAVKEGPVLVSLVVVDSSGNRSTAAQAKVGVVPPGTKVTSFSGTTLVAPVDEANPTYSAAARDLLAGRRYAARRTVVRATFRLVDGPVLGRSTTEVAGRTFSQLRAILDDEAAARLAGLEQFEVRLRMTVTVGSGDPVRVRRIITVDTRP